MEEKKLTDEEIAKALLQSIEYSKTITYFDVWGNCKSIMMTDVIDFISRLQAENETLKSPKFASWKLKFFNLKEEFDKELAEHEKFVEKANAEIERLTEENRKLDNEWNNTTKYCAELQKQVDELKEKCCEISFERYEEGKQDTAKEIYNFLKSNISVASSSFEALEKFREFFKGYGVEVE